MTFLDDLGSRAIALNRQMSAKAGGAFQDYEMKTGLQVRSKKGATLISSAVLSAILILSAFPGGALAQATELRGAGATFPAPLYNAWIERFKKTHPDSSVNYEAVGSGEGLARFSEGELDFAASDVAAPTTGGDKSEGVGAQFPVTAGMVAIAYNLPGVSQRLNLPRSVYVDIFLGKIRQWNDPRIAAANPGVHLPAREIAVVARLDSSGTSFAFTTHLSTITPAWAESGVGVGKKPTWPAFVTLAKGNEGVAAEIKRKDGAIGYVEYGYAKRMGLAFATLENKVGKFVAPSPEAGAASINHSTYLGLQDLRSSILDPSGEGAYPIVSYSWLILRWNYPGDKLRLLNAFVDYVLGDGQKTALDMGYVPLPAPVAYRGKAVVTRIFPSEGGEGDVATVTNAAPASKPESAARAK